MIAAVTRLLCRSGLHSWREIRGPVQIGVIRLTTVTDWECRRCCELRVADRKSR